MSSNRSLFLTVLLCSDSTKILYILIYNHLFILYKSFYTNFSFLTILSSCMRKGSHHHHLDLKFKIRVSQGHSKRCLMFLNVYMVTKDTNLNYFVGTNIKYSPYLEYLYIMEIFSTSNVCKTNKDVELSYLNCMDKIKKN